MTVALLIFRPPVLRVVPVPERFKLLLDRLEAGEAPQDRARDKTKAGADKAGAA